jgi:hypothetical protein
MTIEKNLQSRVRAAFARLDDVGGNQAFPKPATVALDLEKLIPPTGPQTINVKPQIATSFAAASIDMWLRSVHSFLISASLTNASPIWSSVSGYYSSHYVVRALAHLLGHFLLFRRGRVAQLELTSGRHFCSFTRRTADDREHVIYWKRVKSDVHFNSDPFFTDNLPASGSNTSDVRHRDHANYADSLVRHYPQFRPLDEDALKIRVNTISQIEVTDPPIPRLSEFPDLDNVQLIAYHRIVKYRQFLDEILGESSRFWRTQRNPSFAQGILNYQVTEPTGLSAARRP